MSNFGKGQAKERAQAQARDHPAGARENLMTNPITIKLFAGCPINAEMRMHLNQSIQWKHAEILNEGCLKEVHYHGKDYFGLYIDHQNISTQNLTAIQQSIQESLKNYCPDLDTESAKVCIFPQVFIA
jgi:hypothetical protein